MAADPAAEKEEPITVDAMQWEDAEYKSQKNSLAVLIVDELSLFCCKSGLGNKTASNFMEPIIGWCSSRVSQQVIARGLLRFCY